VEFQYNEGLLDNYQYLTELNEKLKKDNWQNGVIYSKGYFKAEYIYLSDTSDDNQDDKVEAKVIYDQEGVTQISVKLNLFEANGSSVTDENKFEKIGALMEEIGANQNDVMKLLKSLNCKSADKTGKLGDLSYQVKVSGVGMDEESNETYADCVLIVSK
jgi:ATPase subunit of ABC transporter with duplicated ATPase domains